MAGIADLRNLWFPEQEFRNKFPVIPRHYSWFFDDFYGDSVSALWTKRLDGGTIDVIADAIGGVVRLTTSAVADSVHWLDWNNIRSLSVSKDVLLEVRYKLGSLTDIKGEMLLYFSANTYLYFNYDTNLGHTAWEAATSDAGVATAVDTGVAPDTDFHIFKIATRYQGGSPDAHFYIDGVEVAVIDTNITAQMLEPFLFVQPRANIVKTADIDYCFILQKR